MRPPSFERGQRITMWQIRSSFSERLSLYFSIPELSVLASGKSLLMAPETRRQSRLCSAQVVY